MAHSRPKKPEDTFGVVVRDELIRREITTQIGNPNWMEFVKQFLPNVNYETLRKAVVGERVPSAQLMETVAEVLGIPPTRFAEYRLHLFTRQFDPREVGLDEALSNLEKFAGGNNKKK